MDSRQIFRKPFFGFHKKNEKGKQKVVFQGESIKKVVVLIPYQILYTAIVGVLCGWQAVWYVRRHIEARGAHPVELCYPLNRLKLLFLIRNHNNR